MTDKRRMICRATSEKISTYRERKRVTLTDFMKLSLAQARLAIPYCYPNPAVGAVIVGVNGRVLGCGHTQRAGQAHAEIAALQHAKSLGHDVAGATIYVTLEPCAHYGRTAPCALALIDSKIAKVVASVEDPNPKVSGQGFQILQDAGIEVVIGPGRQQASEINIGFFSRYIRGRPWVRLKVASSMDGRTALANGQSQWITSAVARENGYLWRAKSTAILTGIGTILKDNPRLDTHHRSAGDEPLLSIIDSELSTPLNANIFLANRPILIFTTSTNVLKQKNLERQGANVIHCPTANNASKYLDLKYVLSVLALKEINEVHVEAGATLNGSLIKDNLVDELIWYVAPKLLGNGAPIAYIGTFDSISQCPQFKFISTEILDNDICIIARNEQSHFI